MIRKNLFSKYRMLTQQPHRPLCKQCNLSLAKPNGKSKHGFQKWQKLCVQCSKAKYDPKSSYLFHKKINCEQCGFVAEDICQLDIVYLDGNNKHKDSTNMKTLCANCNRLYRKKLKDDKSILDITVDADTIL